MSDTTPPAQPPAERIKDHLLDEEMRSSYLTYAMSVIIASYHPRFLNYIASVPIAVVVRVGDGTAFASSRIG